MVEIDEKIIQKAKEGDKAAFDKIITAYRKPITDLCHKYMRNAEEALDMAQEVFCAAYTSLKNFQGKSRISTWLYRIAVNLCINRLDMMKRRKYFLTDSIHEDKEDDKREVQLRHKGMMQDDEMVADETKQMVMECMEDFSDVERNLIVMRDMQGYEYYEISKILNMPLGSVKSKLSRAREKIKIKLIRKMGDRNEL